MLVAAMSPDLNSPGAAACRAYGIPVYDRVDALLEAGGFDVVVNATPIPVHADLCRQCLASGYSVWMEKPPTATIQELDDLIAFSDSLGLQVAVCFNWLYSHLIQELKAELVAGRYGAVRRVKGLGAWTRSAHYFTRSTWAGKLRLGEHWVLDGTLNNPFAHVVCNGLFFAGTDLRALAEPATVEAELYRANNIESEDTSCLRVMTRENVELITHLTLAPDEPDLAPTTVIETDDAVIQLVDFRSVFIHWRDGRSEVRQSYRRNRTEMFQRLCRSFRLGDRYLCDLAMCRPFTVTINAAFDAGGDIVPIPGTELMHHDRDGVPTVAVQGINEHVRRAHECGALFSEIGVPWARPGEKQIIGDYAAFPVRFMYALAPQE